MSDKVTIHDEAPAHKYFTQMLNMAEDDLDPFQYRLLAHYVRWAGDGKPYPESIRATAKAVKMSTKKVDSVIDELSGLGYIEVYRPTTEEARNGKTIRVTVLDRWLENINRFQRKPVVKSTQAVVDLPQPCSKNTTPPVVNLLRSEEQEEEQEPIMRKKREGAIPAAVINPMKDAIVTAFGWQWETMTGGEKGIVQKTAKELCTVGFQPERIDSLYAWCRAKFTTFTPRTLSTHLSEYRAHSTAIPSGHNITVLDGNGNKDLPTTPALDLSQYDLDKHWNPEELGL